MLKEFNISPTPSRALSNCYIATFLFHASAADPVADVVVAVQVADDNATAAAGMDEEVVLEVNADVADGGA